MPKYIQKALMQYKHPIPSKNEYTPFRYNQPVYGMKKQIIEQKYYRHYQKKKSQKYNQNLEHVCNTQEESILQY